MAVDEELDANRAPRIADVARVARAARSTVSLYMTAPHRVSRDLGVRIERAMRDLAYEPNPHARYLRTGATERVCIVVLPSDPAAVVGVFRQRSAAIAAAASHNDALIVETVIT